MKILKSFCWFILIAIPWYLNKILLEPYLNRFIGFAQFNNQELIVQRALKDLYNSLPLILIGWFIFITLLFWYEDIKRILKGKKNAEKKSN